MTITQGIDDTTDFGQFVAVIAVFVCAGIIISWLFQRMFAPRLVNTANGPAFVDPDEASQRTHAIFIVVLTAIPITLLCVVGSTVFGWIALSAAILLPFGLIFLRTLVKSMAEPVSTYASPTTGVGGMPPVDVNTTGSPSVCEQIMNSQLLQRMNSKNFMLNVLLFILGILPAISLAKFGYDIGSFQTALFGFFVGGLVTMFSLWYTTSKALPSTLANFYTNQAYGTATTPETTQSTMGV